MKEVIFINDFTLTILMIKMFTCRNNSNNSLYLSVTVVYAI